MMLLLDVVTIVSVALLIGTEFAVSAFVNPVLWKLDPAARMHATRLFAALLGAVMPFWYGFNFLLIVTEGVIRHRQADGFFLVTASIIWAAVIGVSVLILVPINNRMMQLGPDSSSTGALREHKKWDALHRMRVLAIGVSFVAVLLSIRP
jgi:uncharacterized membrane protein